MIFEQATETLRRAEFMAQFGVVADVLNELRNLSLWDFNLLLLSLPNTDWPNLSRLLPRMASDEVQKSWTGASGQALMATTTDFVRIMEHHFVAISRRTLNGIRVLDFGCGYGRIMRQMYYFTDPCNIYGLDPWERSLEICRNDGILGHLVQSDFVPETLPLDRNDFDLIYAYSVFTHTSMKATRAALAALRRHIAPGGLLVLTTRPAEWWHVLTPAPQRAWDAEAQLASHRRDGFAFHPSNWNMPADGESIFGDTSMTAGWINANFPAWHVEAYDRGIDPAQVILVLGPR